MEADYCNAIFLTNSRQSADKLLLFVESEELEG